MKKMAIVVAVCAWILLLTRIANQMPREPAPGMTFSLKAVRVVKCTPREIALVDTHRTLSVLEKDESWPECSEFHFGEVIDMYLSRGEKTRLLSYEKSIWWRKVM